jgi:hypothetical protein
VVRILTDQKLVIRTATYTEEDGSTEPIPIDLVNSLIAFSAYVRWRNSSDEITERISGNYLKITEQDLIYTQGGSIFRTSDGNYSYNRLLGNMEEVTPRALSTTAPNPSSTLAHSRSPVSEWNRGVRRDKNAFTKLHKLEDLEQWTRDNKKTAKAPDLNDFFDPNYSPPTPEDADFFSPNSGKTTRNAVSPHAMAPHVLSHNAVSLHAVSPHVISHHVVSPNAVSPHAVSPHEVSHHAFQLSLSPKNETEV